ncbi:MAG: SRPBCC family protein [Pseudomonadota bacterium]
MLQFEVEREFAHSADRVWAITGDFGGLKNWLPGILACRVEGSGAARDGGNAIRIVDVFDGSVTKESLESLDAARLTYQYRILEARGFDASSGYLATFRVTPLGPDRCRINWGASFRLPDGIPAEKGERARQRVIQMYGMCLQHLDGVLANG